MVLYHCVDCHCQGVWAGCDTVSQVLWIQVLLIAFILDLYEDGVHTVIDVYAPE